MTVKSDDAKPQGHTYRQWLMATTVNLTMLTYSMQAGWISSMAKVLQSDNSPTGKPLSDIVISWIASTPSLAAVFSVTAYSFIVDKYGRRFTIITIAVLQALGWIIKLYPANAAILILSMVCVGTAAGGCFAIIPIYIKEISQDNIRGTLGLLSMIGQNLGYLSVYALGGFLDYYTVLWILIWIPVVTVVLMIKAPESPAYLIKIDQIDEATSTIAFFRGLKVNSKIVQSEIDAIMNEDEKFKSLPNISTVGIFKVKAWRNGFVYMLMIMAAHGCNGAYPIVTYASTVLLKCGVTISPELQSLSIPAFMIVGSLISMSCVEKLGRKPILVTSFIISVVSFASLGSILLVREHGGSVPGWVAIIFIVTPVCAYAAGVSPLPFVIMSEMFNFQIRAKVMGYLVMTGWLGSFVQLFAFGPITNTFGAHVSFFCFALINIFGAFVALIILPETKGKSIKEIENELEGN